MSRLRAKVAKLKAELQANATVMLHQSDIHRRDRYRLIFERSQACARIARLERDLDEARKLADELRAKVAELAAPMAELCPDNGQHLCATCAESFDECRPQHVVWGIDLNPDAVGAEADRCVWCSGYRTRVATPKAEVADAIERLTELAQELETQDGYQENLRLAVDWLKRWMAAQ